MDVKRRMLYRRGEDGVIRIKPPLKRCDQDWSGAGSVCGKNIGNFFNHVYAAAYGGHPTENGDGCFRPDVIKNTPVREIATEVKATSYSRFRPKCAVRQFEGYGKWVLDRLDEGDKIPVVDYAIFRYGKRKESMASLSNRALMTTLPHKVRDLVVFPLNMAYALALVSPFEEMDHSSSHGRDIEHYRIINRRDLNLTHQDPEEEIRSLEERIDQLDLVGLSSEDFKLRDLKVSSGIMPSGIRCYGQTVQLLPDLRANLRKREDVPVTRFDFTNTDSYVEWLDILYEKQEEFFEAIEGVSEDTIMGVPY